MWLVGLTIVILNVSRFFNIGITSLVVNCFRKKKERINLRVQFVLWVSGLRGAMAYALAMRATIDFDTGALMLVDTLIYALISVLGIGSILSPILNCAKVKEVDSSNKQEIYEFESDGNIPIFERMKRGLSRFNSKTFAPIFTDHVASPNENRHLNGSSGSTPQRQGIGDNDDPIGPRASDI